MRGRREEERGEKERRKNGGGKRKSGENERKYLPQGLRQYPLSYLPTIQGFPGLSRDLTICSEVQGFSPFVQGF